ncbi:hypothetical protein [Novipirellula rosea]|uniref:Uncharacterized protein n=1 Tax=Novipirellula rosea TaxID=1031540 RepID=A0ABP8NF33_9BACT
MPVRLTVVIVQSPPTLDLQSADHSDPASTQSQAGRGVAGCSVDAVLGEMLGLPEIDLTLVNRLETISISSTDHLTLESITGDMVVLDWQTASQTCQAMRSLGMDAVRGPHPDDPDAVVDPAIRSRRVYAFDLRQFADAKTLRESILRLHASKQVKTFSLSLGSSNAAVTPPRVASSLPRSAKGASSEKGASPEKDASPQKGASPKKEGMAENHDGNANPSPRPLTRAANHSISSEHLDALVDQLDDFDS